MVYLFLVKLQGDASRLDKYNLYFVHTDRYPYLVHVYHTKRTRYFGVVKHRRNQKFSHPLLFAGVTKMTSHFCLVSSSCRTKTLMTAFSDITSLSRTTNDCGSPLGIVALFGSYLPTTNSVSMANIVDLECIEDDANLIRRADDLYKAKQLLAAARILRQVRKKRFIDGCYCRG